MGPCKLAFKLFREHSGVDPAFCKQGGGEEEEEEEEEVLIVLWTCGINGVCQQNVAIEPNCKLLH